MTVVKDDLCFVPFDSVVDTAFWHVLSKKKLEDYRLLEGPFPMSGEFTNGTPLGTVPRLNIDHASLDDVKSTGRGNLFRANGYLFILNTIDKFRGMDKQELIDEVGRKYICEEAINAQHDFLQNPNKLLTFSLLTYCDLKHHKFYYWFSFPAAVQDKKPKLISKTPITSEFNEVQMANLLVKYDEWRKRSNDAFFCLHSTPDDVEIANLSTLTVREETHYIGFCDPSSRDDFPGWGLRNLLFALSTIVKESQIVKVLCLRDRYANQARIISSSLVLQISIEPEVLSQGVKFVGWEKWKGKLQPRMVNLSSTMDPVKLADSAVDLNLKLMLWRELLNIDLNALHKTSCLILGCGTLGCNVARELLAWGFRRMTFVDNSIVSYSNPVRQTLFTFEDAKSGVEKALAAAEAVKRILPTVDVRSHNLTIPMPGHPVSYASAGSDASRQVSIVRETCQKLDELVRSHDVIFLLLDTREARWLPTLLSTYYNKLAITAALGFDSFLVLRHGVPRDHGVSPSSYQAPLGNNATKGIDGSRLGCYFCNDVVGPANSTQDRTLDQQCTVSRPGASMMASSLAVELCVGLLQHPEGAFASAETRKDGEVTVSQSFTFSFLPHHIRGFLSQFSEIVPCTTAFSRCSACSQPVLDAYAKEGFDFLLRVFDNAAYLEEVSGLKELQVETYFDEVLALSDGGSDDSTP
ncbi:Ubiquitin-like modifier-activating enzyme ATG7 [Taenia crassiceps]|uniref:Ubiquitin-like modifier-activating enzyme ATG7 n=1 Tax=Taenia crassiceps TaxID=6207 RepID=A0ABR4QLF2_9CEST